MKTVRHIRWQAILLLLALIITGSGSFAQRPPENIALARQYLKDKEYDKALPFFKKEYDQAPFDKNIYDEYLEALLLAAKYEDAEALVQYMGKIRRDDPVIAVDLGRVYEVAGKKKKAEEQFELALTKVSGEDFRTRQLADAFTRLNHNDFAIKVYERARTMLQNPYMYATELGLLHSKEGNTQEAVKAMMDQLVVQPNALNDVKSALLQITGEDEKKKAMVQKQITQRITLQPDNPYWVELLTWVSIQKGDYQDAYRQITALDKKLKEEGDRVVDFSKTAAAAGQYSIALEGYKYVMDKGSSGPMYEEAWEGKIKGLQR